MKLLFLDCDGVINNHLQHSNHYCRTHPFCVFRLNEILDTVPELQIVLSSAWRYYVINGLMTLKGLEELLLTHGLNCRDRLLDITESDEGFIPQGTVDKFAYLEEHGAVIRAQQIEAAVRRWTPAPTYWVALDDLELPLSPQHFVRTRRDRGMQFDDMEQVLALLQPVTLHEFLQQAAETVASWPEDRRSNY